MLNKSIPINSDKKTNTGQWCKSICGSMWLRIHIMNTKFFRLTHTHTHQTDEIGKMQIKKTDIVDSWKGYCWCIRKHRCRHGHHKLQWRGNPDQPQPGSYPQQPHWPEPQPWRNDHRNRERSPSTMREGHHQSLHHCCCTHKQTIQTTAEA